MQTPPPNTDAIAAACASIPLPDRELFSTCCHKLRSRANQPSRFGCEAWTAAIQELLRKYPDLAWLPVGSAKTPLHMLARRLEDMPLIWRHDSAAAAFDAHGAEIWAAIAQNAKEFGPCPGEDPQAFLRFLAPISKMSPDVAKSAAASFEKAMDELTGNDGCELKHLARPLEPWCRNAKPLILAALSRCALLGAGLPACGQNAKRI